MWCFRKVKDFFSKFKINKFCTTYLVRNKQQRRVNKPTLFWIVVGICLERKISPSLEGGGGKGEVELSC
jgi:hypothetical protein